MRSEVGVPLAPLTTLGVGGPAERLITATTADEVIEAVRAADADGRSLLILGGGSNVVIPDAGFAGDVVRIATSGVEVTDRSDCAGVTLRVQAGHSWDDLVQQAVSNQWVGVESLSGIPGTSGATPIQNVGAYGQEVASSITSVRVWDRGTSTIRTFAAAECAFGYRTSVFKGRSEYVVLEVEFQLRDGSLSEPVRYAELAKALGIAIGERAPLEQVRTTVLELRRAKGMVINNADPDTASAGSFFTNPILDAAQADALPEQAPRWPMDDGRVKTSAAWLIEQAGFARGQAMGSARLSSKHALAITSSPGGSAADVVALARSIREVVQGKFDVTLIPEPVIVGDDPALW